MSLSDARLKCDFNCGTRMVRAVYTAFRMILSKAIILEAKEGHLPLTDAMLWLSKPSSSFSFDNVVAVGFWSMTLTLRLSMRVVICSHFSLGSSAPVSEVQSTVIVAESMVMRSLPFLLTSSFRMHCLSYLYSFLVVLCNLV